MNLYPQGTPRLGVLLRLSNLKNTNNDIAQLNALIDDYNKLVKTETTLLILIEALDKFNMNHVTQNDGQIRYWYEIE